MSASASVGEARTARRDDDDPVVPARHPGRWLALLSLAVLATMAVHLLVTNERLQWPVVWQYLFSKPILTGVVRTLELTGIAMVMGLVIGIVVAIGRLSPNPVLSKVAWLYSWFFHGTPLLVQLLFWFYLSVLLPRISIGIPFGPGLASAGTNTLITPFLAAVLGLGLNEGAYMSWIVRSGILLRTGDDGTNSGQRQWAVHLAVSSGRRPSSCGMPAHGRRTHDPAVSVNRSVSRGTGHGANVGFR
ncbi:ABC transporter permease subunit [Streptomyces sp. NBC_01618]|uniref:ABC transporter permease subunit n=1 Tax=Streptomyces sp. NBC_01618 TaxID=2975900 RepID=UPI00386D2846|nr:ABC transporter permease subunit [Streptomyces sp. NBC_01618]